MIFYLLMRLLLDILKKTLSIIGKYKLFYNTFLAISILIRRITSLIGEIVYYINYSKYIVILRDLDNGLK